MPKLTRKNVRDALEKAEIEDSKVNEVLDSIMTMFGASTKDMISKEELDEIKQEAIKEAMKDVPKDFKESQEYKDFADKIAEYEKKDTIRTLCDKGVKNDKYAEMLLGKIDKEKDIDEQLESFKEEFSDMFNIENEEIEDDKPRFGAVTKGSAPKGDNDGSFADYFSFIPKEK